MPKSYAGVTFPNATFPDDPYRIVHLTLNDTMTKEYLPLLPPVSKGKQLLITGIAIAEGFKAGSKSYRTHNPGNVGNTDNGVTRVIPTLAAGIQAQADFIQGIIDGHNHNFPIGHHVHIEPWYSAEIAAHEATYGIDPHLPGYDFDFTGQIDQYVKIYSTGARATNIYINILVSYFNMNGVTIKPTNTLAEIVAIV